MAFRTNSDLTPRAKMAFSTISLRSLENWLFESSSIDLSPLDLDSCFDNWTHLVRNTSLIIAYRSCVAEALI